MRNVPLSKRTWLGLACVAAMAVGGFSSAEQSEPTAPQSPPPPPAEKPASTAGSLAVQVVQGTPGEPAIGAMPISIELWHRGMLLDTITTTTDEHGVVIVESLPVALAVRPLVKARFADLDYQVAGGTMDAEHPHQEIKVVCYAPTETPPAWKVAMRHLMVTPEAGVARVTEVVVVENPDARTWIGVQSGGPKRNTTAFVLPPGATDVTLGRGFHEWCCSTLTADRLVNHLPLMPEQTEMVYSYLLPAKDGVVQLPITAPASVDSMMVVVPASLQAGGLEGLDYMGEQEMNGNKVQCYVASGVAGGERKGMLIAGFTPIAAAEAPAAGSGSLMKVVAAVGGGLLVIAAIVLLLRKPGASDPAAGAA